MSYELLPDARDDIDAARRWYDNQRAGLGRRFGDDVRSAIERIVATPSAGPPWPDSDPELGVRRRMLHRFPYAIGYYLERERERERVVIAAVVHTRRQPGFWLARVAK